MNDTPLIEALGASQRLGMLGDRSIVEVVEHARAFVTAIEAQQISAPDIADIGSGGGVPGLVIAHDLPGADVVLIDRRATRSDHLERLVRRLGWSDRVHVRCADLVRTPPDLIGRFDLVTARGFGPPERTIELGRPLLRPAGCLIISEPPSGDRWNSDVLEASGMVRTSPPDARVAVLRRP